MSRAIAVGCLVCLVGLAAVAPVHAVTRTPEQALQAVVEAARRGNLDDFFAGFTSNARRSIELVTASRRALQEARDHFQMALVERFGAGGKLANLPDYDLGKQLSRLRAVAVVGQRTLPDGSVELQVKTSFQTADDRVATEDGTLVLQQEGSEWKLAEPVSVSSQGGARQHHAGVDKIERERAAFEQVTKALREGRYGTTGSALAAVAQAAVNSVPARAPNPLSSRFGERMPAKALMCPLARATASDPSRKVIAIEHQQAPKVP